MLKYNRSIVVRVTVGNQGVGGNSGKLRQCEGSEQTTRTTWRPTANGFKTNKEQNEGKEENKSSPLTVVMQPTWTTIAEVKQNRESDILLGEQNLQRYIGSSQVQTLNYLGLFYLKETSLGPSLLGLKYHQNKVSCFAFKTFALTVFLTNMH